MPQVASDPKIHAHTQPFTRSARPAQPDRAPSPFESLLDDNTQAPEQPAPTQPDTKVSSSDNAQAPTKANDCKTAATDTDPVAKPKDTQAVDKTDGDDKSEGDDKTKVSAKTVADAGDGIDVDTGDGKPADGPKADSQTVVPSVDNVQTIVTADAAVVATPTTPTAVAPPTPAQGEQDTPPVELSGIIPDGVSNLKAFDLNAPKVGTGKQANNGKPVDDDKPVDAQAPDEAADDSQPAAKTAPQTHPDKPQFTLNDNDKDHASQARGEISVNSHRGNPDAAAQVSIDDSATVPKVPTDTGTPPTIPTAPAHASSNAAAPATLVSQPGPQAAAIPLSGVAIEIAGKALAGKNRFEIRLDPPELGRIEVRLDVDRDGNVTSRLTVDRADTLDLLRRDASGLERALQDAGLKTADNGLQFSLRDQTMGQQQTSGGPDTAQLVVQDDTLPPIDAIPQNYGRLAGQGGGLDIRV